MTHFSKNNIEKLTEFWLLLEGELKQKKMAKKLESLLTQENAVHDALAALATEFETECNRVENEKK